MTLIGHTMMCEQAGPKQLVRDVALAEEAGFDHPAVVAQKAATMQLLSDGRLTLGLGAGENLSKHIVGWQWPHISRSGEMRRSKKTSRAHAPTRLV
jgi:Luciferase-like monooxygenase